MYMYMYQPRLLYMVLSNLSVQCTFSAVYTKKIFFLYVKIHLLYHHHHHHKVSCLQQALTAMAFNLSLSYEELMNWLLSIIFDVAQLFKLSIYVSR